MRATLLNLLIASMLLAGVEGVADTVDESSFHLTHHAHAADGGEQWFADEDNAGHDGDSCEHFCHAHALGLTAAFMVPAIPPSRNHAPVGHLDTVTHGLEPPTPPPDI